MRQEAKLPSTLLAKPFTFWEIFKVGIKAVNAHIDMASG